MLERRRAPAQELAIVIAVEARWRLTARGGADRVVGEREAALAIEERANTRGRSAE